MEQEKENKQSFESVKDIIKESLEDESEAADLIKYYEDMLILVKFYYKVKDTLQKSFKYSENEIDFETYRWILQNTNKSPKEYLDIFMCLPKTAQNSILSYMGYDSLREFQKKFLGKIKAYTRAPENNEK
jgi:hypothetical protein